MKKPVTILAMILTLTAPLSVIAAHDHGTMDMTAMTGAAHEEVLDGIKVTFQILDMREQMKGEVPKGMKETHHVMVSFLDVKGGKKITEGEVKVKVQGPDKAEQTKELLGIQGHLGADFELAKKGKYGVMSKILLKDGKVRSVKFWYTVK